MKVTVKSILGYVGIVIAALSVLLIIVDGVAIIFTYVSLVFVLFSVGVKNKGALKIYGLVFIIAHVIFGWRMYSDINRRCCMNHHSDSTVITPHAGLYPQNKIIEPVGVGRIQNR